MADMREMLRGQDLSFTEIAKLVGEKWQDLSPSEKEPCERQAQSLKDKYYTELNEYKKTKEYGEYQDYLSEFKAKHSQPSGSGEYFRPTNSTISNQIDRCETGQDRRRDTPIYTK